MHSRQPAEGAEPAVAPAVAVDAPAPALPLLGLGGPQAMHERVLSLQRSVGNAVVARYIQNIEDSQIGPAPPRGTIPDSRDPRAHEPQAYELMDVVVCLGGSVDAVLDTEHHWIEMGDESYGWWPSRSGSEDSILGWTGVPGIINGTTLGRRGTATRDPHHGDPARRYPVIANGPAYAGLEMEATRSAAVAAIRTFAQGFSGDYTWNPLGTDCHEFVEEALQAAGLVRAEGPLGGGRPRAAT